MNLSNKSQALEDAARAILEGNNEESLQEVNSDAYRWEDINKALMRAGFGPKVIIKVLMNLKGKKIKESVDEDGYDSKDELIAAIKKTFGDDTQIEEIEDPNRLEEAAKINSWTHAGKTGKEYAELTQFTGPAELGHGQIGNRKMVQITIGKKYIELNARDLEILIKNLKKISLK